MAISRKVEAPDAAPGELAARGIAKRYGRRPVLRDVSARVALGEAVALLGANGAGKTTCFQILAGLAKPDAGAVSLDGRDITRWAMYRRAGLGIAYLPQEASLFHGLTVEENIRLVLQLRKLGAGRRRDALERALEEFGLHEVRGAPASAISGGERRRVEIARALASEPSFLLLDEPLAGVDPIGAAEIQRLTGHLKNRGLGVLMTDHNVRETLRAVDRAYILNEGVVLHEGTPGEVVAHAGVRGAYLGEDFAL